MYTTYTVIKPHKPLSDTRPGKSGQHRSDQNRAQVRQRNVL